VLRATTRDPAGRPADAAAFLAETVSVRRALRPEVLDDLAGSGTPVPARAPAQGSPTLAFGQLPHGAAAMGPHAVTEQVARGAAQPVGSGTGSVGAGPAGTGPAAQGGSQGGGGKGGGRIPAQGVPYPVPARLQRRRRRGMLALLTVLILTFAVGLGAWHVAVGNSVTTPSLLNLTRDAAEAKAAEAGLKVRFAADQFDEVVPKGEVISTDPAPGRKVAEGGTITVVLSKGPERYIVPDLANETVDAARQRLTESNLTVADNPTQKYSDTVPDGKVIGTDPAAGQELRRDAVVKLIVSKGAKPVDLPDVVGKTVDEATSLLEGAGFKVTTIDQDNNDVPNGTVLAQSPTGNRKVGRGTTVQLTVAKSQLVQVPRVIGMNIDDAQRLLEGLGFQVDRAGLPFGNRVTDQDPQPGQMVPYGSTVTLRVF
jgi:serine/threonine-protein kinase